MVTTISLVGKSKEMGKPSRLGANKMETCPPRCLPECGIRRPLYQQVKYEAQMSAGASTTVVTREPLHSGKEVESSRVGQEVLDH